MNATLSCLSSRFWLHTISLRRRRRALSFSPFATTLVLRVRKGAPLKLQSFGGAVCFLDANYSQS
jgi:hypothetical protein